MSEPILQKRLTAIAGEQELIQAIVAIARDRHSRLLLSDEDQWKGTKLKEIARLASILNTKIARRTKNMNRGATEP